jgi:hypothetical protein
LPPSVTLAFCAATLAKDSLVCREYAKEADYVEMLSITLSKFMVLTWLNPRISMNTWRKRDITVTKRQGIGNQENGTLAMMHSTSAKSADVRFEKYAENVGIQTFRTMGNF